MLKSKCFLGATVLALVPVLLPAAILTNVPMQGGMVMPMVSYDAAADAVHVMMPAIVPQLTPLLVSNPADGFDPADPWYDTVDPARQGASFSRRYGFVMDGNSDLLPPTRQIWVRKLSGSPELRAFRYRDTAPKAWEAIFGTGGVTNALYWNLMMFHPAFTAPPGTNELSATFEVYLLDTATGLEVPNSSSGPVELHWTNVPDGRPVLSLATRVVVGWPVNTTANWRLEWAGSPDATSWSAVTNSPMTVDGEPCVVLEGSATPQFFRMRYVP